MTKLLQEAFADVELLSDEAQDEIAASLLGWIAGEAEAGEPIIGSDGLDERIFGQAVVLADLDEETRAAVLEGLEQAERGEFVSEDEIRKLFHPDRG